MLKYFKIKWQNKDKTKWQITDNTFTKDRAYHLAKSMEGLSGIKHCVIETESEREAEIKSFNNSKASEQFNQVINDCRSVDKVCIKKRSRNKKLSNKWITATFDAVDKRGKIEALSQLYDDSVDNYLEYLYTESN